jgi:hypothetical protein
MLMRPSLRKGEFMCLTANLVRKFLSYEVMK